MERRGGDTITYENAESGSKEEESPADTLDRVKVVFLGAPGVGKSSIIRVSNVFTETDRYRLMGWATFEARKSYATFRIVWGEIRK